MKKQALSARPENRHIILICAVVLFEFISFGIANPILPQLIGDLNQTTIPTAAYVFAIFLVSDTIHFFWAPALGTLSDRLGRRRILVVSVIGLSIGSTTRFFADQIYIFLLVSVVYGFVSATLSTAMSSASDVAGKDRRTVVFGWITGCAVSGYTIGPIIGGIASDFDNRLPFLIAAIIGVLNLLFVVFFLKETLPPEKRQKRSIGLNSLPFAAIGRQPRYIKMMLSLFFLSHFVMSMPHTFVVIYLIDRFSWSGTMIGAGLAMHMFVSAFGQLVISGWLSRKWSELKVTLVSIVVSAIFLILLGLGDLTFIILASFALFGIIAMVIPASASLISVNTPPENQGEIQGVLASMMGLSRIVSFGAFGPVFAIVLDRSASPLFSGLPFVFVGVSLLIFVAWVRNRIPQQPA
ncbi:MAG: MFS transporter [Novosphingobium sp.]|nr:MFS transporter [Novosphingobium sp.]